MATANLKPMKTYIEPKTAGDLFGNGDGLGHHALPVGRLGRLGGRQEQLVRLAACRVLCSVQAGAHLTQPRANKYVNK
jgi:hypothetical protein